MKILFKKSVKNMNSNKVNPKTKENIQRHRYITEKKFEKDNETVRKRRNSCSSKITEEAPKSHKISND